MHGTRILTRDDRSSVLYLLDQNKKTVAEKMGVNTTDYHLCYLDDFLSEGGRRTLIGHFNEEEELTSCIGLFQWSTLPFCTITFLLISPRFRTWFRPKESGYIACLDRLFHLGEKSGLYDYYYFRRRTPIRKAQEIWWSSAPPILQKYTSRVEAIIPAGTQPTWRAYAHILENQVWPFDCEIRKISLKAEHFDEIYNL